MKFVGWIWFVIVQLIMIIAMVIGWFLLIPFCLTKQWRNVLGSMTDRDRTIDEWNWKPLNWVYGNPEDGVSGHYAKIWINGTTQQWYMLTAPSWWRAYCWSALRNSCDNLKYVFAWSKGPYAEYVFLGRTWKFGWQLENGVKVPVF